MLDYINKYQAGGTIDTDKLRNSLKEDERYYKKGDFTLAGRKRLIAIDQIAKNQESGIRYNLNPEDNTFNTVDEDGKEVQVGSGRGRSVTSNSPMYGALSQDKRIRSEVSKLVGKAFDNDFFVKEESPKLDPKEPKVSKEDSKKEDNSKDGVVTTLGEYASNRRAKSPLENYFDDISINKPKLSSGVKTSPSGGSYPGQVGSENNQREAKVSLRDLRGKTGDQLPRLENIEREVQMFLQSGMYEQLNVPKSIGPKGSNDPGSYNIAKLQESVNKTNALLQEARDLGKPEYTDKNIKINNHYKQLLRDKKSDVLSSKVEGITSYLKKKSEEARNWNYNSSEERAATIGYLDQMRKAWASSHEQFEKELPGNDEYRALFGQLSEETPLYQFEKDYKVPEKYNPYTYVPVVESEGKNMTKGVIKRDPKKYTYWDHIYGTMVPAHYLLKAVSTYQSGGDINFDQQLFDLLNYRDNGYYAGPYKPLSVNSNLVQKPKSNYSGYNTDKGALIPTIDSNLPTKKITSAYTEPGDTGLKPLNYEDGSLLSNKQKKSLNKKIDSVVNAPTKDTVFRDATEYDKKQNPFGLGQTGFQTPVGNIQYNDVGQFLLATIAKNKKIADIKPFYERFQDTGSRDVLAARDLDSSTLNARENQINNTRSQYAGSDAAMDMISKNMAEANKSAMKDRLLAERGSYRRSEEDRVAEQMEQKRQQQAANLAESNAVYNRNAERKMQYDTLRAQEEQRRDSEFLNNIGSIMTGMQSRANVNAAKERDLVMADTAAKFNKDRNSKLASYKAYDEEYKLAALNNDAEGMKKYGAMRDQYSAELEEMDNKSSSSLLKDYNDIKKKQKLIRRSY